MITVQHLTKTFGDVVAVDDVSFDVFEGEIFGLLGPNGAGKTTTLDCLEGLKKADDGQLRVLGHDPWNDRYAIRQRIGVQLQESRLQARIKVSEALDIFASFYDRPHDWDKLWNRSASPRNAMRSSAPYPAGRNNVSSWHLGWSETVTCCFSTS